MRYSTRLFGLVAALAAAAFGVGAVPAQAEGDAGGGAVFVQTNSPAGNVIDAYRRSGDGTLTFVAGYATGGAGAREQGSVADPLASQGSLELVPGAGLLLAVNAGSDTISVFGVEGARLHLVQTLPSGGLFPSGVAVRGSLVYALNAGVAGAVSGFRIAGGRLHPIEGSTRSLGLANTENPFFLSSPAEAGFSPDGAHLVVTTKGNGGVDVFSVGADGRLGASPVVNATGHVPFAFLFDRAGRLVLNYADTSSLQLFALGADGAISPLGSLVGDGQAAACWVAAAGGYDYVANAGSGDVSVFKVDGGSVSLVDPAAATGIPGAVDTAIARGRYVYVESEVTQTVHVFAIGPGGSLGAVQVASVPLGADMEGIAAG